METIDRVRESRKQADIAYEEIATARANDVDVPESVLADLSRAEECLRDVIGALEGGED